MHHHSIPSTRTLLLTGAGVALLSLAACGGGKGGSAAAGADTPGSAPLRLFPSGVNTGTLAFNDARNLTITPTYNNRDYTQGFAEYSGSIKPLSNNASENETFTGCTNLYQLDETTPGRIVLEFTEGTGAPLTGRLVLTIPASGVNDAARTRTGTVENTTTMHYTSSAGTRSTLNLTGATVTISWGK